MKPRRFCVAVGRNPDGDIATACSSQMEIGSLLSCREAFQLEVSFVGLSSFRTDNVTICSILGTWMPAINSSHEQKRTAAFATALGRLSFWACGKS